jgi:hypothetical protein
MDGVDGVEGVEGVDGVDGVDAALINGRGKPLKLRVTGRTRFIPGRRKYLSVRYKTLPAQVTLSFAKCALRGFRQQAG